MTRIGRLVGGQKVKRTVNMSCIHVPSPPEVGAKGRHERNIRSLAVKA